MILQIIRNDWKDLLADRSVWLVGVGFALLLGYAIYNGAHWSRALGSLNQAAVADQEKQHADNTARLERGETKPAAAGQYDPSDPYSVGADLNYAVLPLSPFAFSSIGQSDLLRPKIGISVLSKQRTEADKQGFENPLSLLAGRFDLAFVIIYLLPLLILALSFNLLSAERENGTLQMVLAQPVSPAVFAVTKLLHRAALTYLLVCGVSILVTLLVVASVRSGEFLGRLLLWLVTVPIYALFWFALALFVNSLRRSSATNALLLAGCWIALVLVIPSLVNVAITSIYPMPSRIDEINAIRGVNLDMRRDGSRLVSEFYQDHPELSPQNDASEKAFTLAFVTIQQELKRKVAVVEDRFSSQLGQQQSIVNQCRFISPSIAMQEALNQIAGTDVGRYQRFRFQARTYAEKWDATFLPAIYRNLKFTVADYDQIPRFSFSEQSFTGLAKSVMTGLLGIFLMTVVLLWWSMTKLRGRLFGE